MPTLTKKEKIMLKELKNEIRSYNKFLFDMVKVINAEGIISEVIIDDIDNQTDRLLGLIDPFIG